MVLLQFAGCSEENEVTGTPLTKVNGTVITQEDINRAWQGLPAEEKAKYMDRPGRGALINNMVALELLYQEAKRQKLGKDPEIADKLKKAEQNILVEELIARSIQPADLYRMYQENYVKISGILMKVSPPEDAKADLRASRKIDRIYEDLKKGADFDELAKDYSQEKNAERTSELGYFTKSLAQMTFGFDAQQAIFNLKKEGDISKPVRGREGYYIFKLLEKQGNLDPNGFDPSMGRAMYQEKSEEVFRGYVNELKSRADIQEYKENMEFFLSLGDSNREAEAE